MLEQLKQVTEGRARAVRTLRPNLRSLFEAYEAEPDPDRRADMLTNAVVCLLAVVKLGALYSGLHLFTG